MGSIELVNENGLTCAYRLDDGRIINVEIEESYEEIYIFNNLHEKIGRVELSEVPPVDDYTDPPMYYLTWMYMDIEDETYKHKGIGREVLKFFKRQTGASITAAEDDGLRKSDGSHLTGDAPSFVEKMRQEGVIA